MVKTKKKNIKKKKKRNISPKRKAVKARPKKRILKLAGKKPLRKKPTKKKPVKRKSLKKKSSGKKLKRIFAKRKTKKKIKKTAKKTAKKFKVERKKAVLRKKAIKKIIKKTKESQIVDSTLHKTKIRIIGVGGGGSTIVSEIASRVKKVDFYIANTDSQALKKSPKRVKRFQFGQDLTRGMGTGMNAELGEKAAQAEEEKIKKFLEGQDLCIIIASLGGGTSSGAGPVFAKISKNLGNITYGIFTLPFKFEGEKKMEMAKESLEKIKPYLNVYSVIPNERIFQFIDKSTSLNEALSAINERLANNLEGLIEMIYLPGLINIDFADLRTILSGRGRLTYLNAIEVEGPNKKEAIGKLVSSPLYPYNIKGAKGILYNIVSGKDMQLSEVNHISGIVSELISQKAKIIFGINQSFNYRDRIKITLLASGCSPKGFSDSDEERKGKKPKKAKRKKVKPLKIEEISKPEEKKEEKKEKLKPKPVLNKEVVRKQAKKTKPALPKQKKEKPIQKQIKKTEPLTKPKKEESAKRVSINEDKVDRFWESAPQDSGKAGKVRKNALQVRKEAEEAEKEILDQEKVWDIPAILRRKK